MKESRWTKPTDLCPHPEYWTSEDEQSTENEVLELVAGFVRALQPEYVIETGSAFGFGSLAIGKALAQNGHGKLVTLEVDRMRAAATTRRVAGLPVEVRMQSSLEYTPTDHIDFAWFDSLFELRVEEFFRYRSWMSERTVVGFHDTAPHHPVRDYLDRLAGQIVPVFLPTPRGVCFAQVV